MPVDQSFWDKLSNMLGIEKTNKFEIKEFEYDFK